MTFEQELTKLINRYSLETNPSTPDHILAKYLVNCLKAYETAVRARDTWCGITNPSKFTNLGIPNGNG